MVIAIWGLQLSEQRFFFVEICHFLFQTKQTVQIPGSFECRELGFYDSDSSVQRRPRDVTCAQNFDAALEREVCVHAQEHEKVLRVSGCYG